MNLSVKICDNLQKGQIGICCISVWNCWKGLHQYQYSKIHIFTSSVFSIFTFRIIYNEQVVIQSPRIEASRNYLQGGYYSITTKRNPTNHNISGKSLKTNSRPSWKHSASIMLKSSKKVLARWVVPHQRLVLSNVFMQKHLMHYLIIKMGIAQGHTNTIRCRRPNKLTVTRERIIEMISSVAEGFRCLVERRSNEIADKRHSGGDGNDGDQAGKVGLGRRQRIQGWFRRKEGVGGRGFRPLFLLGVGIRSHANIEQGAPISSTNVLYKIYI